MAEDREQGGTTESTERIPPGSMPPDDRSGSGPTDSPADRDARSGEDDPDRVSDLPEDPSDEERADKESMDSFPASDPPAW